MEVRIKLNLINIQQPKWKIKKYEEYLKRQLCSDLSSLGFISDQGIIRKSDEQPPMKYNFDGDA